MSYRRVIPRDLFNEGNLLKCLGQLYLVLENSPYGFQEETASGARLDSHDLNDGFDIRQDPGSGGLYLGNVRLALYKRGRTRTFQLMRPLNSRRPYPLYVMDDDGDDAEEVTDVFEDNGELTTKMKAWLKDQLD